MTAGSGKGPEKPKMGLLGDERDSEWHKGGIGNPMQKDTSDNL